MDNEYKDIWERITRQFSSPKKSLIGLARVAAYWFAIAMGIFVVTNDMLRWFISFSSAGQIAAIVEVIILIVAWREHTSRKNND